ncbi:hypothetical protein IF1G_03773 [Cordyceps javanica]|uniref:Uncharacterized protein n=1 Tax=Cordyceps javanica TaxID=43265 RepID=A0A545V8I3_9HYPO|nr:hypothetical protein IF1G_03773 [Cordyceps javanica]
MRQVCHNTKQTSCTGRAAPCPNPCFPITGPANTAHLPRRYAWHSLPTPMLPP